MLNFVSAVFLLIVYNVSVCPCFGKMSNTAQLIPLFDSSWKVKSCYRLCQCAVSHFLRCHHFLSLLVAICAHGSVWRIMNCIHMVYFGGNGFLICN